MKRTALLILIALLMTACIAMLSYLVCVGGSYTLDYGDLDIQDHSYQNGTFTIKVSSSLDGEYLYKVLASPQGEPGDLTLTFRGGKQPSRAQTPDKVTATFQIDVPDGTTRIVCDGVTVYTIK